MKLSIYIAVLLGFILCYSASCRKEKTHPLKEVFAGVYDDDFIYRELKPPLEINFIWDSLNLYAFGTDSIDFDMDGMFDLLISASILNKDSLHLLNGMPNPFPHYRLEFRNDLQIAFYWESFYVGLGQTAKVDYADTLSYQERIDQITNWDITPFNSQTMWSENPAGGLEPSFGGWYYAQNTKYFGIKLNSRFGWVEIDNTDNYHPKFIRYAIVK